MLKGTDVTVDPKAAIPQPAQDETLLRVLRAGVCETDLQLIQGYMGFQGVLGHEFVGIAQSGRFAGRRVVGEINCHCRKCDYCRDGLGNHCPHRTVLGILQHDGAFADYVAVPDHNLHAIPDSVSTDEAVFTEPLAAAFRITDQLDISRGQRIVVLGDGRLGNLCAQVLHAASGNVTVVGKHVEKLAILEELGIDTRLLDDARPDRTTEIVVDCTGSATGLPTALRFVRPRGTIVLKTTVAGEQTLALAQIVIDEITVVGSRCGPFARAVAALEARSIAVSPLISARYGLDDAIAALAQAQTSGTLKVLLDCD